MRGRARAVLSGPHARNPCRAAFGAWSASTRGRLAQIPLPFRRHGAPNFSALTQPAGVQHNRCARRESATFASRVNFKSQRRRRRGNPQTLRQKDRARRTAASPVSHPRARRARRHSGPQLWRAAVERRRDRNPGVQAAHRRGARRSTQSLRYRGQRGHARTDHGHRACGESCMAFFVFARIPAGHSPGVARKPSRPPEAS
ncbi:hypothetical protein FHX57_000707 [Paraburkholderia tropica]|nr:hypothetical protein [Paraburkholderia tropica]MBB6317436.1 hypothetical protein [Paraburkholderia tropica]